MADGFYNIVLIPDADLSGRAVAFAQKNFSEVYDGYCLSGSVMPHVTLGQFNTDNKLVYDEVVKGVEALKDSCNIPSLSFKGFCARYCEGYGSKGYWLELSVANNPMLNSLQRDVYLMLEKNGLKPLNPSLDVYYPHLTFARVLASSSINDLLIPSLFFEGENLGWRLAVGHSDSYG